MKLLPDANQHVQFLDGLEAGILKYIQMQANSTLGPPGGIAGGAGGMGGMGGGVGAAPPGMGAGGTAPTAPAAPPPPGMGGGPPMGGGGQMPNAMGPAPSPMQIAPGGGAGMSGLMANVNPDDLRRLLAQRGAAGA
jgi:hypothetical protein